MQKHFTMPYIIVPRGMFNAISEEGGRGYVPLTTKDLEAETWVLPGTVQSDVMRMSVRATVVLVYTRKRLNPCCTFRLMQKHFTMPNIIVPEACTTLLVRREDVLLTTSEGLGGATWVLPGTWSTIWGPGEKFVVG